MELRFSTKALLEMDAIAAVMQQDSSRAALRFLEAVEKTGENLLTFPEFGARLETDDPELQELRLCLVQEFAKYLVFYRIRPNVIRIERVVHGARDLPSVLKE